MDNCSTNKSIIFSRNRTTIIDKGADININVTGSYNLPPITVIFDVIINYIVDVLVHLYSFTRITPIEAIPCRRAST